MGQLQGAGQQIDFPEMLVVQKKGQGQMDKVLSLHIYLTTTGCYLKYFYTIIQVCRKIL